jgi:hypothetical protein
VLACAPASTGPSCAHRMAISAGRWWSAERSRLRIAMVRSPLIVIRPRCAFVPRWSSSLPTATPTWCVG